MSGLIMNINCATAFVPLKKPTQAIDRFKEIATQYPEKIAEVWNALSAPERVFSYYIYRASLSGARISALQNHRDALPIIELCEQIVEQKKQLLSSTFDFDISAFMDDLTVYLVYLWTNHGHYFSKEHANEKRTPSKIGLPHLTPSRFVQILEALDVKYAQAIIDGLTPAIFDENHESTLCVSNDIAASAVNVYAPDFTEQDYQRLSVADRNHINGYFYIEQAGQVRIPRVSKYKVGEHFGNELAVAVYWLKHALEHALKFPNHFDAAMVTSLDLLIKFLQTGDEELFKQHSIEWLKTNNKLDYLYGFIETYNDPKGYRGFFEAEVTVKTIDMHKLNSILPSLEQELPFRPEYQRQTLDSASAMPNASINQMLFGIGANGPLNIVAAYCLPNYSEIRSTYGSKQIIYQVERGLGEQLDPQLYRALFNHAQRVSWLNVHDASRTLHADIWNVHCILHETLGHGSGRLAFHTFVEGDNLRIGNANHTMGDVIPVTSNNINELLRGYEHSLEELRAEIIALYTSIFMFEELAQQGLYKDWPEKIGKEVFIDCLIVDMAWTGLGRLKSQPDDSDKITGAHAQANTTITNYLLDSGAILLIQEELTIENKKHQVLDFVVVDRNKALEVIKELAQLVQEIKSTADGKRTQELFETYGTKVRNIQLVNIIKQNMKAVMGELKVSARLFPDFYPVVDSSGTIVDCNAQWPKSIIEQCMYHKKIAMLIK